MSMADHPDQLLQVRMSPGTPEPGVETFFLCSSDKSCQILLFLFGIINIVFPFSFNFLNHLNLPETFTGLFLDFSSSLPPPIPPLVLKPLLKPPQVTLLKKFNLKSDP